tara:strand:+ start:6335 stop:7051 length:717 start_codon:yes stop_codon:yes gene_type:complete
VNDRLVSTAINILLLLLIITFASSTHGAPPASVKILFEIKMGDLTIGQGIDTLQHDSKSYWLSSKITPRGLASLFLDEVERESSGSISETGLVPERFTEKGNKKKGDSEAHFEWEKKILTLVMREGQQTVALPTDSIDQAVLPYQFSFKTALPEETIINITDGRRLKQYVYERKGDQTLTTPIGILKTAYFKKIVASDTDRQFEFWLSYDHHLLPVKIRFVDKKGNAIESNVQAVSIN